MIDWHNPAVNIAGAEYHRWRDRGNRSFKIALPVILAVGLVTQLWSKEWSWVGGVLWIPFIIMNSYLTYRTGVAWARFEALMSADLFYAGSRREEVAAERRAERPN